MNNQEAKSFLETMYSYVDKKMQTMNSNVAKVIGGQITGTTPTGRYKVKINAFDNEDKELTIFPLFDGEFALSLVDKSKTIEVDRDATNSAYDEKVYTTEAFGDSRILKYREGDYVFVLYWGDLTNAKILCKNM